MKRTKAEAIARRALAVAADAVDLSPLDYLDASWEHLTTREFRQVEAALLRLSKQLDPDEEPIEGEERGR